MTFLPDREQIATFVYATFKHATPGGWVSLRQFPDKGGAEKPSHIELVKLNGNLEILVDRAYAEAHRAANTSNKTVFCPPVAVFATDKNAKEVNLCEGPVFAVELDRNPQAALEKLEQLLGQATVVVTSGGVTSDDEPKLHAHWRLAVPARTEAELEQLKEARALAVALVDGDTTNIPVVHPIRWPGSWHRKGEPQLCKIKECRPDREIDLVNMLEILRGVATPKQKAFAAGQATSDFGELVKAVLTGENYHDSLTRLAAKVVARGFSEDDAASFLRGVMEAVPEPHNERWQDRYDYIPRAVSSATDKFGSNDSTRRLLRTSAEFVSEFTPPDYLIDGILLRGYLYAFTAPTGGGKTAIALTISLHAAMARPLGEHGVDKNKVLYLAGENDIDVRMRWIKTCEENALDPADVDVVFMPGVEKLSDKNFQKQLVKEAEALGPFGLVFVDTSAAYNEAEDENANVQMQEHARVLRELTKTLPGGPTVIALCHPVKTPNMDSLVPKGGGNFLNAIDGNLCCKMDRRTLVAELGIAGKFRGPEFAPLAFALKIGTSEKIKDSKGRMIKTVTARLITEEEREKLEDNARCEQTDLLILLKENDRLSMGKAAEQLGWSKSKVQRLIAGLNAGRFVEKDASDRYVVTDKGIRLIKERLEAPM